MRDFWELSPKRNVFITAAPLKFWGSIVWREAERLQQPEVDDFSDIPTAAYSRHSREETHRNSQRQTLHNLYDCKPVKIPTQKWEKVSPLPKTLFTTDDFGEGNISFLQLSGTGYINHAPGQFSCTDVVGKHNMHSTTL